MFTHSKTSLKSSVIFGAIFFLNCNGQSEINEPSSESSSIEPTSSSNLETSSSLFQSSSTEVYESKVSSPVETKSPNTDYPSAFEGQTRVEGLVTQTPYQSEIVFEGLDSPWGMDNLPDGRLLITQKSGSFILLSNSGTAQEIPSPFDVYSWGQGGLLDVAVHPNFIENREIYWTFSKEEPGGNLTAVGKGTLSPDEKSIQNAQVIYKAIPAYDGSLHFGSRLEWDTAGNLFVSTGERSDLQTRPLAQDLSTALGKVLRITTSGQAVSDNPFLQNGNALPEIYSYGHRNPQGLATHPSTGQLWQIEFGPKGGDEVNLISAGLNYGWPEITYGVEYSGSEISGGSTQKEGMEQPNYYWDPAVSPSGATFYTGKMIPEWKDNLFIGALSARHIVRLKIEGDKIVGEERLFEEKGLRIRDLHEGVDGSLYAISDGGNAKLFRIFFAE